MEIKDIVNETHKTAKEKGFWDAFGTIAAQIKNDNQRHDAMQAFYSQKLMLTVSELSEALEALRSDKMADRDQFTQDFLRIEEYGKQKGIEVTEQDWRYLFETLIKNTFEDELADALIRIFDLCGKLDIDIEWHLQQKMQYNGMRPYKHGRNF